jgi:hypothetical protein
MYEGLNRRAGSAVTADPIAPPVSVSDLQEYLALPSADSTLAGILAQATGAVVRYLGRDLIARDWTLTHWDWPATGTVNARNLGRDTGGPASEIPLPYGALSVASVERYGEAVSEYVFRGGSIVLGGWFSGFMTPDPALVVQYRAGFGETAGDVPEEIRQAVLALAAFNYDHRGACDADEAMKRSGAAEMLGAWRSAELFI